MGGNDISCSSIWTTGKESRLNLGGDPRGWVGYLGHDQVAINIASRWRSFTEVRTRCKVENEIRF